MGRTDPYILRCVHCGARNRIPPAKVGEAAHCGKCGRDIDTHALEESRPRMATDRNFESDVLQSPLPVLAFFWAPWCPTCVQSQPTIDRFAAEARGRLRVVKINVDSAPAAAQRYDIRGVPFIVVFDNGQVRDTMPGALDRNELMARMAKFV
jgi:thioredoxin